jgi:23S rRNA G2069 N7-methylase RlmK/C1962 C5-methylase RlmI
MDEQDGQDKNKGNNTHGTISWISPNFFSPAKGFLFWRAIQAQSSLKVISLAGQPEDFPYPVTFPEGRYLKFAVCVKG